MRNRNIFITTIILLIIILITLTVTLVKMKSIDVAKELTFWTEGLGDKGSHIKENVKNPFDLVYFLFGFVGLLEMVENNSTSVVLFAIGWAGVLPLTFILLGFFIMIQISLFIVDAIRREYKNKALKKVGKLGMYTTFYSTVLIALIGLIMISILESTFNRSELKTNLNLNKNHDAFSIMTLLTFLTDGSIFGAASKENLEFTGPQFNSGLLLTTIVFLIILLPISGGCLTLFASMWIATFISDRHGAHSKFRLWLQNIRVDSKKDYYRLVLHNTWLWILTVCFGITLLMPGLIHPYKDTVQILITVFFIVITPLVFSPIMIGIFMSKKIKWFNYNLLMFIQITVLLFAVLSLQIIIWLFLKVEINVPTAISSLIPLITTSSTIFAFFGFIKFQKK